MRQASRDNCIGVAKSSPIESWAMLTKEESQMRGGHVEAVEVQVGLIMRGRGILVFGVGPIPSG